MENLICIDKYFFYPEYELYFNDNECLELSDFLPKYGDIIYNELYKELEKEPTQYQYDCFVDIVYGFYLDKWRKIGIIISVNKVKI